MARPFWSGQVQISLVSFGVKLFPATEAKSEIRFHQINRKSGERVRHKKVSEGDEEPVEKEDIVKGYEYSKGHYVQIDPKEVDNLRIPSRHTLELLQFVDRKTGVHEPYITLSTPEALVQMAQIGVLEVHPWGSHNDNLEKPDRIVIDLDPDPAIAWQTVAESARNARERLTKLGLDSFVKTTGGKGLHVVVPIRPEHEWPAVKQFAHNFVLALERDNPKLFLAKMTKAARVGKIYLDYLRNDRNATAVAPYSPRARTGLPVAMPLSWNELNEKERPRVTVSDIQLWRKRLQRDPWRDMLRTDQRLKLS